MSFFAMPGPTTLARTWISADLWEDLRTRRRAVVSQSVSRRLPYPTSASFTRIAAFVRCMSAR